MEAWLQRPGVVMMEALWDPLRLWKALYKNWLLLLLFEKNIPKGCCLKGQSSITKTKFDPTSSTTKTKFDLIRKSTNQPNNDLTFGKEVWYTLVDMCHPLWFLCGSRSINSEGFTGTDDLPSIPEVCMGVGRKVNRLETQKKHLCK